MNVDKDLHDRFSDVPTPPVPLEAIVRRGQRLRWRRRITSAVAAVAGVAVVTGGVATLRLDRYRGEVVPAAATITLDVFLRDDITRYEMNRLRKVALGTDGVVRVDYVSKREAYEEFKEHYADEPEYWENLPMDALPARFTVTLEDDSYVESVTDRLDHLPGVDAVRAFDSNDPEAVEREEGPTTQRYRLIAREGSMKVWGPKGRQPWGWCPSAPVPLTSADLNDAEKAVVVAAEAVSGGLDTRGASADSVLLVDHEGPPDFARAVSKTCEMSPVEATALVTLHLPRVDSASMGATTYFVSKESRGWVLWDAW